jgi:hypothetical protein
MSKSTTPQFVPGLELSRRFYREAVRPVLDGNFGALPHAAALIGSGSEALGYDDVQSTDHHWGPRLLLFLCEEEYARRKNEVDAALREQLPYEFLGYPTNFSPPNPHDNNVQLLSPTDQGPVNHMVVIETVGGYVQNYLGYDLRRTLEPADWLTFPMQKLRALTAGAVYHDDVGLEEVRARFAFYPHDVWLYLLAAGWARIGQEEHLMGRAGSAGDEVGAALIAARLVRDVMRLCFLMERQYPPYAKWFGTAFCRLACAEEMLPALERTLQATTWQERERGLVPAYEALARMHNALQLTDPLPQTATSFHGRPFRVMALHGFTDALLGRIADPAVQRIAARPPIGGIDLFSDNTDLLENPQWRAALRRLYA